MQLKHKVFHPNQIIMAASYEYNFNAHHYNGNNSLAVHYMTFQVKRKES